MDVEGRARFGQYAKYVIQLIIIGDAGVTWANMFSVLRLMLVGIFSDDCFVLPPGGNNQLECWVK